MAELVGCAAPTRTCSDAVEAEKGWVFVPVSARVAGGGWVLSCGVVGVNSDWFSRLAFYGAGPLSPSPREARHSLQLRTEP